MKRSEIPFAASRFGESGRLEEKRNTSNQQGKLEPDVVGGMLTLDKDELQFITEINATGILEQLVADGRQPGPGLSLEEVKSATNDHTKFVDSLSKKASTIRANLDRCQNLVQSSDHATNNRIAAKNAKLSSLRAAKARLEESRLSDENELERSVTEGLIYLDQLADGPESANGGAADSYAAPNDRFFGKLLDKLQALGQEVKVNQESQDLLKTARYYSNLEVMLSVVSCRRTLNSVLREALEASAHANMATSDKTRSLEAGIQDLLEEINSLWDEVVPVAHMAVEKTLLGPILRNVNMKEKSQNHQNAIIGAYITSCLSFMNERLEASATRVDIAIQHHLALLSIYKSYLTYFADGKSGSRSARIAAEPIGSSGAVRDSKGTSRLISLIREAVEGYAGFPVKALDVNTSNLERIAALDGFVAKRQAKDEIRLKSMHAFFESTTKKALNGSDDVNADVVDCLEADSLKGSGYEGAVLHDGQIEESLDAINEENKATRHLIQIQQVNQALGTDFRKCLRSITTRRVGAEDVIPVESVDGYGEPSTYQISPNGLEIMKRWSEQLGSTRG